MVCVSFEESNLDSVEVRLSLLEMRLKSEVTLYPLLSEVRGRLS